MTKMLQTALSVALIAVKGVTGCPTTNNMQPDAGASHRQDGSGRCRPPRPEPAHHGLGLTPLEPLGGARALLGAEHQLLL